MIHITDRSFTLGDGLFETLLAVDEVLEDAGAHLSRMRAGCETLGLPPPDDAAALALMAQALRTAGLMEGRAAVRLTYSAGEGGRGLDRPETLSPQLYATAAPSPLWTSPARVTVASIRRNEGSPGSRLKTLSYLDNVLARRAATQRGADEAIMLNNAGHLAGAAAGNLFWLEGEMLCTPSLACGVLDGIMRRRVIANARALGWRVREDRFSLQDLEAASAVFITNALIGARPALAIDGREFDQQVGELVATRVMVSDLRGRK